MMSDSMSNSTVPLLTNGLSVVSDSLRSHSNSSSVSTPPSVHTQARSGRHQRIDRAESQLSLAARDLASPDARLAADLMQPSGILEAEGSAGGVAHLPAEESVAQQREGAVARRILVDRPGGQERTPYEVRNC